MKFLLFAVLMILLITSCKKEVSCGGCDSNNNPPVAIAGADQQITLPTDTVLLDGSASKDLDGTIVEWRWTKISGPTSYLIDDANNAKSLLKNLVPGIYQFELMVKDNEGLAANDTIQITVKSSGQNHSPIANAGPDQTIYLPVNSVNLDGSLSFDPDNNIVSYI